MLISLSIRNVVLIDKLDLTLEKGLGVFTGETGAGKSILLDSLSLVLGARADTGLIRHGEPQLSVSASFRLSLSHPALLMLTEQGLAYEENELIIRRIVSRDGRSKAFINDQPVSVAFLKTIGETLIEIHGQFASHSLLNPTTHLNVLDEYGQLGHLTTACRRAYNMWQYKHSEREVAEQALMISQHEEAFLKSSLEALSILNPQKGEEEKLTQQRTRLMNAEKIISALDNAYQTINDEQEGVLHKLSQISRHLEKANQLTDGYFESSLGSIYETADMLSEAGNKLEKELEQWDHADALPAIDDRLFALRDAARKHQTTIDELPDLMKSMQDQLNQLEKGEETLIDLKKEEQEAWDDLIRIVQELSEARQKTALLLDEKVKAELPALKLEKAVFHTQVQDLPQDQISPIGLNQVVFTVSTNPGMPLAPLHKIASGGELARFMLALKVNLAQVEQTSTLIFDEVDSGIGGATAAAVGQRLKRLAEEQQVLVVTHSPQVAAYGTKHWMVTKSESDRGMITLVKELDYEERIREIARMLSGSHETQTATAMARELMEKANEGFA